MNEAAGWQFDIEVHPPGWSFSAGTTWLAGWIGVSADRYPTDLRVWIDDRPFLGLPGLPKPGMDERFLGHAGPPYTGFVAQVTPHRSATRLRVEVRDPGGEWAEIFRTLISVAPNAEEYSPTPTTERIPELLLDLLRLRSRQPKKSWRALADEVAASALAIPLNTLPNPPFHGALEEPQATGRTADHRLVVTGWLAHRSAKIRRLVAIVDGRNASPLLHGLAREDVGAVFSDLADGARGQFVGQVDVVPEPGTLALLKIFAELERGELELVFAQRFLPRVTAGPDFTVPHLSCRKFFQAWWALHTSVARSSGRLGPFVQEFAALREAWARYREEAPSPQRRYPSVSASPTFRHTAPRRILAATHNLNFEGAPRLLLELLTYLRGETGAAIHVLSPQEGPLRELFETAGMTVQVIDLEPALRANNADEFRASLRSAVTHDCTHSDLIIANTLVSFWAIHLAVAAGKPSLFYVHESAPIRRFFPSTTPRLLAESALRHASQVAFTADASRQVYARLDPHARFRVLPTWLNVVAIDAFAARHAPAALRAKHGISPTAFVVLNLGAVCARKGQHVFVRAADLLAADSRQLFPGRELEFVMVGARGDSYQAALQQQVAEAGLDCVRFVPETRENFDWLRLADMLVCTSFEESSPRVLLEAAAFRLPIVSTDVNGIPELVTGSEARLIPPGDPRLLTAAIRETVNALIGGDGQRINRARAMVEQRFDERVALPQHLALASEAARR